MEKVGRGNSEVVGAGKKTAEYFATLYFEIEITETGATEGKGLGAGVRV